MVLIKAKRNDSASIGSIFRRAIGLCIAAVCLGAAILLLLTSRADLQTIAITPSYYSLLSPDVQTYLQMGDNLRGTSRSAASTSIHGSGDDGRVSNGGHNPSKKPAPAIPRILIFTHKQNLLETKEPRVLYDNVMNTINVYKKYWNDDSIEVQFLDDDKCREKIKKAFSRLVPHFDDEKSGPYKADVCRIAALYLSGGYYFNVNLQALKPVDVANNVTFLTAEERSRSLLNMGGAALSPQDLAALQRMYQGNFFQAFLATAPKHPVLKKAFRLMLQHFEGEFDIGASLMGAKTLAEAFRNVDKEDRGVVRLLKEMKNVENNKFGEPWYPDTPKQEGEGATCNYIVHDPNIREVYFYSRVVCE